MVAGPHPSVRYRLAALAGAAVLGAWIVIGGAAARAGDILPSGMAGSEPGAPSDPGATEDVTAGSKTVRGHYRVGDIQADWEAAVRNGKVERIVEWRDYGEYGNANIVFDYFSGQLMHYGERSQRRGGQAGAADSFRRVSLNLNFANGKFVSGTKTVDGIDTELDDPDISGALAQSRAALDRVLATRSSWQGDGRGDGQGGSSFSLQSMPAPDGLPSDAARRLAGDGLVDFRCDTGLHVLIGSADDRMVVDRSGEQPVVLEKQPPGNTYDYMGNGWGAQRRGDTIKLDRQGGPSLFCGVVSAAAPPSAVPPPTSTMPDLPKPPAPPLPLMPPSNR